MKCVSCIGCCVIWFLRVCVVRDNFTFIGSSLFVFSNSPSGKMFSGVTTNTTFGSPVASESAPAPEVENSAPVLVAKAAPAKSKSCRSAVVASAPHVVESLPLSAPTQRSREERDATGRVVASRLGLAWPPSKRIRRPGRPPLMHSGVMRSIIGHEMSLSDIMTMICVFSANVLVDGGLVMPWYQPRHPVQSSVERDAGFTGANDLSRWHFVGHIFSKSCHRHRRCSRIDRLIALLCFCGRVFDTTQENSPGPDTVRIDSTETDTERRGDGREEDKRIEERREK